MKKIKETLSLIFSFAMLGFIGFIIYIILKGLGTLIINVIERIASITSSTDSVVIVALITGGISIVTVIISSVISKMIEYRQSTRRYLFEKRELPYKQFIQMVYKLQRNTKGQEEYTQQEMIDDISKFSQGLTLWGSSRVIKKWIKFREVCLDKEKTTQNLLFLEDIVFEIRKDMGQGKKGLKKGDLLSFFINDIKEYLSNLNKKRIKDSI